MPSWHGRILFGLGFNHERINHQKTDNGHEMSLQQNPLYPCDNNRVIGGLIGFQWMPTGFNATIYTS